MTGTPRIVVGRRFQLAIHERGIEDHLCPFIGNLRLPPLFHLASHWFEASLNPIDTDGPAAGVGHALDTAIHWPQLPIKDGPTCESKAGQA